MFTYLFPSCLWNFTNIFHKYVRGAQQTVLTIYEDSNVKNSDCNMFMFKKGFKKVCGRLYIHHGWVTCWSKWWWWSFGLLLKVLCFWTLTFHLKLFGEELRYEYEQSDGEQLLVCMLHNNPKFLNNLCVYMSISCIFFKVCKMLFHFVEGVNWSFSN